MVTTNVQFIILLFELTSIISHNTVAGILFEIVNCCTFRDIFSDLNVFFSVVVAISNY